MANAIKKTSSSNYFKSGRFVRGVLVIIFFVAVLLPAFLSFSNKVFAAGDAYFSLSPASGIYTVGNNIVLTVSETSISADNVNAVQANFSYPASQLQYKSMSLTGPFTLCGQQSGGGGSVDIGCASTSTVSGTQQVAQVTFTVLASGSATVSMSSGSDIDNNSGTSVWNSNLPSTSYTLSNPSSGGGGGGGSGSGSGGGKSSGSSKSSSSASKTPTTASTTPTTSTTTPTKTITTTPTVTTTSKKPAPTVYLTISVTNGSNVPVVNAKVVLDSKYTAYTNSSGKAVFSGLKSGTYSVSVTGSNGSNVSSTVSFSSDQSKLDSLKLPSTVSIATKFIIWLSIVLVTSALGLIYLKVKGVLFNSIGHGSNNRPANYVVG